MARGEHRSSAAIRRIAAALILLATGGIVAVIGTAAANPEGTDSAAAGCRPDLVSVANRAAGRDRVQGSRAGCTSDAQPALDGNKNLGEMVDGSVRFPGRVKAGGPFPRDFTPVELMAPNVARAQLGSTGSAGSFTSPCGTNAEGHRNSDNFMGTPGKVNSAEHIHDYVGNLSTDAFSTDESLAAASTTCTNGDKSTYFWPVLRNITVPGIDANATTNGGANANAAWTCTGFEDRTTTKYPLCPQGSQLVRILDFPSCWGGKNLDSANHRTHVVFPQQDGSCSGGKMAQAVDCINTGRTC